MATFSNKPNQTNNKFGLRTVGLLVPWVYFAFAGVIISGVFNTYEPGTKVIVGWSAAAIPFIIVTNIPVLIFGLILSFTSISNPAAANFDRKLAKFTAALLILFVIVYGGGIIYALSQTH